ncbi:hypothetical protein J2Z66_003661 [Paenibacillus eucommiae]|uniref:Uncharacterized protein n=1 Tax=Paenibacillus eucommiae TaxID=1355755 RepID=A0ABS4IX12_9BACL|nr:hypothetical protein [Paenibacillus eucommiae]
MTGTSKLAAASSESRWLVQTGEARKSNGSLSLRWNRVQRLMKVVNQQPGFLRCSYYTERKPSVNGAIRSSAIAAEGELGWYHGLTSLAAAGFFCFSRGIFRRGFLLIQRRPRSGSRVKARSKVMAKAKAKARSYLKIEARLKEEIR